MRKVRPAGDVTVSGSAVRCPSELALEEYLLEGSSSEHAPHVATCTRCAARIARMKEEGRHFLNYVFPATVEAVEAAADHGVWWMGWRTLLVPAAAALAMALLVLRPAVTSGPAAGDADRTQLKGTSSLKLAVFLATSEGAQQVADGAVAPAGSAMRFKVTPTRTCRAWIASVDGGGSVSRLYPTTGDSGAEIVSATVFPGGAFLDGAAGPERIFVFCAPRAVPYATVEQALRRAYAAGESAVRSVTSVPGLPPGTAQDSVLVEKAR